MDKKTFKVALFTLAVSLALTALLNNAMTAIDIKPTKPVINAGIDSK